MPGFGFAMAATTLVGQGLGARNPARARADGRLSQWLAAAIMSCMGVVFFLFPGQIIGIFINDPQVIQLGIWPLRLVAFSQPILATSMVLGGALRGAGDTRTTLFITGGGLWLVRIPLAWLLVPRFGPGRRVDRDEHGFNVRGAAGLAAFPRRSLDSIEGMKHAHLTRH